MTLCDTFRSVREANEFAINVNLAAESGVQFALIYDELLTRRRGLYQHVINIDPGQAVRDLRVKVNIVESKPITFLTVPEIRELHENAVHTQGTLS